MLNGELLTIFKCARIKPTCSFYLIKIMVIFFYCEEMSFLKFFITNSKYEDNLSLVTISQIMTVVFRRMIPPIL